MGEFQLDCECVRVNVWAFDLVTGNQRRREDLMRLVFIHLIRFCLSCKFVGFDLSFSIFLSEIKIFLK